MFQILFFFVWHQFNSSMSIKLKGPQPSVPFRTAHFSIIHSTLRESTQRETSFIQRRITYSSITAYSLSTIHFCRLQWMLVQQLSTKWNLVTFYSHAMWLLAGVIRTFSLGFAQMLNRQRGSWKMTSLWSPAPPGYEKKKTLIKHWQPLCSH